MGRAPPVVRLALAFAAGVAWRCIGAPVALAPLVAVAVGFWPNRSSASPASRGVWLVSAACGFWAAALAGASDEACPRDPSGGAVGLEGRFLTAPVSGSGPFRPASACADVTVIVSEAGIPAGRAVHLVGRWRAGRGRPYFVASEVEPLAAEPPDLEWRWWAVRWREHVLERYRRLYGSRAPLVAALTLARREGLDPALRESFARVGIAHLLAISGFHVGVIAGIFLFAFGLLGVGRRSREMGAAGAAWVYVAFIGFPDAACRAALMLTLVALSRARGRPAARWAPLGAALLILVAYDPRKIASPGFQLSFAGAGGLTMWGGDLSAWIRRVSKGRCPAPIAMTVAAGLAATAATVPIVAWHFERVSLLGIPATVLATPWVALALAGSLVSLMLDFVWPGLASFVAGGVSSVLAGLEAGAAVTSSWRWTSVWTTRSSVVAGILGLAAASYVARRPRIGAPARRLLGVLYVLSGVSAWPLLLTWQGRGSVELLVIDVGQGDAIALRSPRGRWLLVDAGPAARGSDPGAHPTVRALRARGVRTLEALVLTHPDLDHIGGAGPVLSSFNVRAVYDPALPAPKQDFLNVLDAAAARGVPWRPARSGQHIEIDGLRIDVLHPPDTLAPDAESNATSVVLHASFGDFDALLTGDAYKDVERALAPALASIEVLKVGHHGSDTSTDSLLLVRARPEVALISVGRSNRYGHPSPAVLGRLRRSGAEVRRTDREGTLSVLARQDGSYSVTGARPLRGGINR